MSAPSYDNKRDDNSNAPLLDPVDGGPRPLYMNGVGSIAPKGAFREAGQTHSTEERGTHRGSSYACPLSSKTES